MRHLNLPQKRPLQVDPGLTNETLDKKIEEQGRVEINFGGYGTEKCGNGVPGEYLSKSKRNKVNKVSEVLPNLSEEVIICELEQQKWDLNLTINNLYRQEENAQFHDFRQGKSEKTGKNEIK